MHMSIQGTPVYSSGMLAGQMLPRHTLSFAEREARVIWNYLKDKYSFKDNNIFCASLAVVRINKSFDCDDFARVCYEYLTKKGITAKVIGMKIPPERNEPYIFHAICVYKDGKVWRWMDNTERGSKPFDSFKKIPTWYYGKPVPCTELNMQQLVKEPLMYEDEYVEDESSWNLSQ